MDRIKENKNILIVSQYFWPENFRVNELVLALKKEVTLLRFLQLFQIILLEEFFQNIHRIQVNIMIIMGLKFIEFGKLQDLIIN